MAWRQIFISEPAQLRLVKQQIGITQKGEELTVPLEDVAFIILDTPQVQITGALLVACAESGCFIVTTNNHHLPNGLLHSFHCHYNLYGVLSCQISVSEPCKKRLWQSIIKAKVANQAQCLELLGLQKEAHKLELLCKQIKSGDSSNVEAQAAKIYFSTISPEFGRDQDGGDRFNAMLNYAYALLRSAISQALVAHGFLPAFGIHHANMQNAFNLSDDLIEPWRPLVDFPVIQYFAKSANKLEMDKSDRHFLLKLFEHKILLSKQELDVLYAIRKYVGQLHNYYESGSNFDCPSFREETK